MRLGHLAQRMFNTPVAIRPEKAEVIMAALAERMGVSSLRSLGGDPISMAKPLMMDDEGYNYSARDKNENGYDMAGPVAVIPVHGTLVQKLGTLRPYSGMTGYD